MTNEVNSNKNVTYVPPTPEVLEQVARGVCEKMAEINPAFKRSEVIYGFAAFLNVMARMRANRLNAFRENSSPRSLDSD